VIAAALGGFNNRIAPSNGVRLARTCSSPGARRAP